MSERELCDRIVAWFREYETHVGFEKGKPRAIKYQLMNRRWAKQARVFPGGLRGVLDRDRRFPIVMARDTSLMVAFNPNPINWDEIDDAGEGDTVD